VVILPDIQEVFFPEFFTSRALYARDRHFIASTHMADRVITISEFTRQTIVRHHGVSPEKIAVAHLCADPIFYAPAAGVPALARLLPKDFIVFPANFWKHKNHDALLQALVLLERERGLAIDLVLTGHAVPNGYPVEAKARQYGIAARVHYLGYLSTAELAVLYRQARMLVFPSRFEGFGLPLVEAMASGCPIAAANATSIPEVVGRAALLFDPASPREIADAIERVWRDAALRHDLAAAGRREAERFSPARVAAVHVDTFAKATQAYSWNRYLWQRLIYAPYRAGWAELRRLQRAGLLPGGRNLPIKKPQDVAQPS
jgi:glycosyltransferase involved in cell wall biosynthesis